MHSRMMNSIRTSSWACFTRSCDKVAAVIYFIVATSLFLACTHDNNDSIEDIPDAGLAKSRTVMVYMVAENSLGDRELKDDIKELIKGRNSLNFHAGDHLIVYVDDNALPRIYEIKKDETTMQLADLSPVCTYKEDVNSASAVQLRRFVQYVKQHYPAKSYGLVMWSHALGWIPSTYAKDKADDGGTKKRAFGLDNEQNSYDGRLNGYQMSIEDMAAVLEAEGGVDFILFDACFMQCIEVAYAMRNATHYVIASPAEIPGPGANYATMVPAMFQKDDYVQQMLSAYYTDYEMRKDYGIVISAIETAHLETFAMEMWGIVQKYQSQLMALDKQSLLSYYVYGAWGTICPDYLDMQGVMRTVLSETDYEQWKMKLDAFVTCQATDWWYSVYPYGYHGGLIEVIPSLCCGVSMTIPFVEYASGASRYDMSFQELEWAQMVWSPLSEGNDGQSE